MKQGLGFEFFDFSHRGTGLCIMYKWGSIMQIEFDELFWDYLDPNSENGLKADTPPEIVKEHEEYMKKWKEFREEFPHVKI